MYDQNGELADRRELLKVKRINLADEARLIKRLEKAEKRRQERLKLAHPGPLFFELQEHRKDIVRRHARAAHLAHGFISGRPYRQIEQSNNPARKGPDWPEVERLIHTYGKVQGRGLTAIKTDLRAWKSVPVQEVVGSKTVKKEKALETASA